MLLRLLTAPRGVLQGSPKLKDNWANGYPPSRQVFREVQREHPKVSSCSKHENQCRFLSPEQVHVSKLGDLLLSLKRSDSKAVVGSKPDSPDGVPINILSLGFRLNTLGL